MHLHTGTHVVEQLFGMSVNMDTILPHGFQPLSFSSLSLLLPGANH